jgi:hypothetical protein
MAESTSLSTRRHLSNNPSQFLQPQQIAMIDEALRSLGEFGEVRLIVEKGRLRFVVTQKSFDALKWEPGSLIEDGLLGSNER